MWPGGSKRINNFLTAYKQYYVFFIKENYNCHVVKHFWQLRDKHLTLIQLGEVKDDLANFDVKFRTKFLCLIFVKLPYSCRNFLRIFLNFWHDVKNYVLTSILTFFVRKSVMARLSDFPASDWFYCHYRPPRHGRSPAGLWSAVRWGVRQPSYKFLVPGRECGGRRDYSRASLFLSKVI